MTEPKKAEPSESKNEVNHVPTKNHWFETSLIPSSRSTESGGHRSTQASGDYEDADKLGRQFSEIAVDALREKYASGWTDSDHAWATASARRNTSLPRLSKIPGSHRSATRYVRQTSVVQTVPRYPYTQTAKPIRKDCSSSSEGSQLTFDQRVSPSICARTSSSKLHSTPSQPTILPNTRKVGENYEVRYRQHRPRRDGQARPYSMHITAKMDPDMSRSISHGSTGIVQPGHMRIVPSCPSHLGPIPTDLIESGCSVKMGTLKSEALITNSPVAIITTTTTTTTSTTATSFSANAPKTAAETEVLANKTTVAPFADSPTTFLKNQSCYRENRVGTFGLYNVQETIGCGNFSQVKLATHILTKELVAIKVLDKTRMDAPTRRLLSREISILEMLHHPNIIRLYEVMETLTRLHLVMEFVAGGDLNKRISCCGKFSEFEAKIIFAQLIAAVNHLHERNIFHRDIKADNILFTHRMTLSASTTNSNQQTGRPKPYGRKKHLRKWFQVRVREAGAGAANPRSHSESGRDARSLGSQLPASRTMEHLMQPGSKQSQTSRSRWDKTHGDREPEVGAYETKSSDLNFCPEHYRVKLADFGFSKLTMKPDQPLTTFCGSPAYAAPELFQAQSYHGGPVDMWALGIVLFFLLTGLLPYRGPTVGHVRRLVLENRGLQPPPFLSTSASDLYMKLTARRPEDRPSAVTLMRYAQRSPPPEQSSGTVNSSNSSVKATFTEEAPPWTKWLMGQTFPKALPRFKKCPPLVFSLRQKNTAAATTSAITTESSAVTDASTAKDHTASVAPTFTTSTVSAEVPVPNADGGDAVTDGAEPLVVKSPGEKSPKHSSEFKSKLDTTLSVKSIAQEICADEAEMEAARMLLELGVTREEIAATENLDSRNAVTGAYRIMLHRAHRARRLSRLDPSTSATPDNRGQFASNVPHSLSTSVVHKNAPAPGERPTIPTRPGNQADRRKPTKPSRFCLLL